MSEQLRTAAQQALEALEGGGDSWRLIGPAIDVLHAALEQPEQEPVACPHRDEPRGCYRVRCQLGRKCVEPLYTHPPRREQPKFTLSCGCPSQYGGVPAYWNRDGSTAFGMICERHWHEYGARSNA